MTTPDPDQPSSARDHWEQQADDWITLTHSDPLFDDLNKPSFLDLIPEPGRLTIEVGCGEGRMSRALAEAGHRVVGFDASPALARAALTNSISTPVAVADIARLPIAAGVADIVVCFMVLMDIEDLDGAVAELTRVMAPGGTLCVAILHPIMTSGLFVPGDEYHTFYMGEYAKPMRHMLEMERRSGGTFHLRVEHRPIESYFRAFAAAGLAVTALREPLPSAELAAAHPEFENARRVPNFLHFLARRVS